MKAHAPSVGRPGFASGPSVERTRRPGWSGRRSGRGPRDHAARRGWRHGSTRYASIADDSEVDLDRPIKCCDDMHSISHYPPAPAMCGGEALRGAPAIGEILTVANARAMGPCTTTQRAKRRSRCIPLRGSKAVETCAAADRCGRAARYGQVRTSRRVEGKVDGIRPTLPAHIRTRQRVSSRSGENSGRRIAGPSIGHMAAADEAGGESPAWPAKRPGSAPG